MRGLIASLCFMLLVPSAAFADAKEDFKTGLDEPDPEKRFAIFLKAAEQGYAEAQSDIGTMYYKGQGVTRDYKEAVKWRRKAAEQGYAEAELALGAMYILGRGVTQDFKEAAKWFRKAAEQGNAEAQYNLGLMYYKGQEATRAYKEFVKWYRRAAELGLAGVFKYLGFSYAVDHGVLQDNVKAHMWLTIADANGVKDAGIIRDSLESFMIPTQIAEAQKLAREWIEKHKKK